MKVNVFGLGYVGCVTAACLANSGHTVYGVDIDALKVEMINAGKSPMTEPGLEETIKAAVASGRLSASDKVMKCADLSIICVGTPGNGNGSQDLGALIAVSKELGEYMTNMEQYHVVNVRSTVIPGTVENVLIPILESHSGKHSGIDFGVCMNPEFLREGTSITDFYAPPFTVVGQLDAKSGDVVTELYHALDAPVFRLSIRSAEMLKYVSNAFHALKVTFANEVGAICKQLGIDSCEVMDLFAADKKLNISQAYLKPGFAFGGSCLPKDLRAILHRAKELDIETPMLRAILPSNQIHIERAYDLIKKTGKRKVGVIGLSFKAGTDDLRESPMVELIEKLLGKGYIVSVFDSEVAYSRLFGSNKRYIEGVVPHISQLLRSTLEETIEASEVIVLGSKTGLFGELLSEIDSTKHIIDLVNVARRQQPNHYDGVCW